MLFTSVFHHYLRWHYSRAFSEIFHVWLNFLWFTIHLFSIPQLFRAWFAPFKRIVEDRGETWSFEALASYIIVGFISRLLGFIVRSIIIGLGLIILSLVTIGGFVTYLFWVISPAILIGLIGFGIALIIF